jgi:hypothetical protein
MQVRGRAAMGAALGGGGHWTRKGRAATARLEPFLLPCRLPRCVAG